MVYYQILNPKLHITISIFTYLQIWSVNSLCHHCVSELKGRIFLSCYKCLNVYEPLWPKLSLPGQCIRLYLTLLCSLYFLYPMYLTKMKCLLPKDCKIQLFPPSGVFENPTASNSNHTCRVLINAPPSVKIRIQALHIGFNSTNSQSTYIMVHTTFLKLVFISICCICNWKERV